MNVVFFSAPGFDYSTNQLVEGLYLLYVSGDVDQFVVTNNSVHHGSKTQNVEVVSVDDAVKRVDDADLVIFSSAGDIRHLNGVVGELIDRDDIAHKRVFVDGCDSNCYLLSPEKFKLYFKRELRYPEANCLKWPNVRSLTFGVYDFHRDEHPPGWDVRDIDVSFVCFGGSHHLRPECADILTRAHDLVSYADADMEGQPLDIDEYRKIARRSKVIVSLPGAGLDTLRFWEAMGFGAVVCSFQIHNYMVMRYFPEPYRHVIYFDTLPRMLEQTRQLVNDRRRWEAMRGATDQLIWHHTTKARAGQLLDMFQEMC